MVSQRVVDTRCVYFFFFFPFFVPFVFLPLTFLPGGGGGGQLVPSPSAGMRAIPTSIVFFIKLGPVQLMSEYGTVTVTGRVRPTQERQTGQLTDTADGPLTEIRRIEIARLAPQFGGSLAPVYLDLVESSPAVTDTDPTPVPPPELDDGPHLSYAMQWFIFAVCVLIGWVLAVRRSIKTRRAALRPPATTRPMPAAAAPDSAPHAADAAPRARSEPAPASPR